MRVDHLASTRGADLRKKGSLIFILGTALVAFARNIGMLLAGRFILGAGVGMMQPGQYFSLINERKAEDDGCGPAAPSYIVELAPQQGRGRLAGESVPNCTSMRSAERCRFRTVGLFNV